MPAGIKLPWDWYDGVIPENAELGEGAYVETSYTFSACRSRLPSAVQLRRGAQLYNSVMLDIGPRGRITLGDYSSIAGGRLICDAAIAIGSYCLISWNVMIMDCYRLPLDPALRRSMLERVAETDERIIESSGEAPRPVTIGDNVWIGFDACVLPGVHIGEGSVVAAKSVVVEDVPPYSIVGGNPAQVIRSLAAEPR